jgi:hypothetical protein
MRFDIFYPCSRSSNPADQGERPLMEDRAPNPRDRAAPQVKILPRSVWLICLLLLAFYLLDSFCKQEVVEMLPTNTSVIKSMLVII